MKKRMCSELILLMNETEKVEFLKNLNFASVLSVKENDLQPKCDISISFFKKILSF